MSAPPPRDLQQWSKRALVREVKRLRALLYEHAQSSGDDPREQATDGNAVVDAAGDPNARGGVLLDARRAVLLDEVDVSLVDDGSEGPIFAFLALAGRVNYSTDRVQHAYVFDADGAAALATELAGLALRSLLHPETEAYGLAFVSDYDRRMEAL